MGLGFLTYLMTCSDIPQHRQVRDEVQVVYLMNHLREIKEVACLSLSQLRPDIIYAAHFIYFHKPAWKTMLLFPHPVRSFEVQTEMVINRLCCCLVNTVF